MGGNIEDESNAAIAVTTTFSTGDTGLPGYSTYHLELQLAGVATNLYTIYGTPTNPMLLPPAWQVANVAFGSNRGGVNPLLLEQPVCDPPSAGRPDAGHMGCGYDSWLTVGMTDGDSQGLLGSNGIEFSDWCAFRSCSRPASLPTAPTPFMGAVLLIALGRNQTA
eukprot:SAG31_NODE_1321_length_8801_cov_7.086532_4_plen_165_part_00